MIASKSAAWFRTRQGYALLALVEFAGAYVLASLALDSGSLIEWFLTFVLLLAGVQNVGKLLASVWKKDSGKS